MNLMTYSQKLVLDDRGDTLVCFSVPKSKFLLKQVYKVAECDTLLKICERQKTLCDTITQRNARIIFNCFGVNDANERIIKVKDYEITRIGDQLKDTQKQVRRQKVYKWFFICTTGLVSGYLGYYTLKHP